MKLQWHDQRWQVETRAALRDAYDAVWLDGFWKGMLLVVAVSAVVWLLGWPSPDKPGGDTAPTARSREY